MKDLVDQEIAILQQYINELGRVAVNPSADKASFKTKLHTGTAVTHRLGNKSDRSVAMYQPDQPADSSMSRLKSPMARGFRKPEEAREVLEHLFSELVSLGVVSPGETLKGQALRGRLSDRKRQTTPKPEPIAPIHTDEEKRAIRLSMMTRRLDRQNRIIEDGLANKTLLDTKTCSELLGSLGKNPRQFLAPKRTQLKVFGITHNTRNYFPIFQFVETKPGRFELFPDMEKLLKPLYAAELNEWDVFFWFDSPNRLLGGEKPRDLLPLPGRGEQVVRAAEKVAETGAY